MSIINNNNNNFISAINIHTLSTQHNAKKKTDMHTLVMNNVMHIKAKDNTKKKIVSLIYIVVVHS